MNCSGGKTILQLKRNAAILPIFMCLAAASQAKTTQATAGNAAAISRVENGLRPAVIIAGQPAKTRPLSGEMSRLHVLGASIAVLRGGRIGWAKGYGVTRVGGGAVTPNTLFQAGSISKPITALAALRLVQAGRLALDADVNASLRGWTLRAPAGSYVTLRELLAHTAGTTVHGFPGYVAGVPVPTVEDILSGRPPANTKAVIVDTVPGTSWRYSGGGYTIIQKLIGDVTGQPFADVLKLEVLEPAGMTLSRFSQPLEARLLINAALPHDGDGKAIVGGPHVYPELAAAGLWSTPSDLARFAIAVRQSVRGAPGALLDQRLSKAMLTPGKGDYGLGLEVRGPADNRSFSHGGSNEGYQNFLVAYSGSGDGAVVMTNASQGDELSGEIIRSIAAAYDWPSYRSIERKSVPVALAVRMQRAGEYQIPDLGSFVIAVGKEGLSVSLKEGVQEPLYAMDAHTYFILSQDLTIRFADEASATTGRIVSGPFDLVFSKKP